MSRILITGGSGFIGSHVVREFVDHGLEVVCLVRETSDPSGLEGLPVLQVVGDIHQPETWAWALAGCQAVVHCAGRVSDWGPMEDFRRANVDGTVTLLTEAARAGVEQMIVTGTNSVFGEEDSPVVKDEQSPHDSHYDYFLDRVFPSGMNHYRDTKAEAITRAVALAGEHDFRLTILHPVWVYGEREMNTGFLEYLRTVRSGVPCLPGSTRNRFHVIYARDLARAYRLAFERALPGVNHFIIGNERAESMDRIYTLFCRAAGLARPCRLPKSLVYPVAFALELFYTLAGARSPPPLTRARVNMFYDNIEYSTRRARDALDFRPAFSLEEGIARTVAWYRSQNLI